MHNPHSIEIALATFNGSDYIEELLESLSNQTMLPSRLRVRDDCSTDGTLKILFEWSTKHPEIETIVEQNSKNLGWRANFHKLIESCTLDYIFLADQDDIWLPHKIEQMSEALEQNDDIYVLTSNVYPFSTNAQLVHICLPKDQNDNTLVKWDPKLIDIFPRPGWSYAVKQSFLHKLTKVWGDSIDNAHDVMIYSSATANGHCYNLNAWTGFFRRHEGSATLNSPTMNVEDLIQDHNRTYIRLKVARIFSDEEQISNLLDKKIALYERRIRHLSSRSVIGAISDSFRSWRYYRNTKDIIRDVYTIIIRH